ncbi:MAG: phosphomannomutase/phosphoglucomutase [Gammaproteobacteria bacterium]|nr:phosphomannomutase/phosphoglucomutase [Gammaproteobacteria bacterium]MCH9743729.1 phosphomannomutase/phosphoglucomutase [Gammaproteobacteria bacterium]
MAVQGSISYHVPKVLPEGCFRTYDIRGEVGDDDLNVDVAYAIGLALGSMVQAQNEREVVVGRDGRLTGVDFKNALVSGLRKTGCDVVDIGMVATPLVYYATKVLSAHSGVMVTASHNPASHNGFKMVVAGKTVSTAGVQEVLQRIKQRDFVSGDGGYSEYDVIPEYIRDVCQRIKLKRPIKVVVDCGNGAAGLLAPQLYRELGCEVVALYEDVDGRFPNHHPDPTVPENLQDIIAAVKEHHADLGLAFDGDADRVGLVTDKGEIIWPDRQVMLFARDVLSRQQDVDIVFDVKCSSNLAKVIRDHGGHPVMSRTGHSLLKSKMLECNAPMAGEMSGHIFFQEDWYGFDDGIYVGARLMRILSEQSKTVTDLFTELPDSVNTPELKLPMSEDHKKDFMRRLLSEADFADAEQITIDGLRVEFPYGWGLVRPSNTSAYLILRFEADTQAHLQKIRDLFRRELLKLDPKLQLPF